MSVKYSIVVFLIHICCRKVDGFSQQGHLSSVSLPTEMVMCSLQDLIKYFQPVEGLGHEAKQISMAALKNRQNMFQEEVTACVIVSTCPTSYTFDRVSHV